MIPRAIREPMLATTAAIVALLLADGGCLEGQAPGGVDARDGVGPADGIAAPPGAGTPVEGRWREGHAEADTAAPRWFPGATSFRPLLAAPREVALSGGFIVTDRDRPAPAPEPDPGGPTPVAPDPGPTDYPGANVEADVRIGHRVGVLRLQPESGGRPELTLGFEVGVFTRFFMETPQKDLIDADFRVGVPLSLRSGPWEGRFTVMHVSSHFGDDFVERFDPPVSQSTRDGVELLVARRVVSSLRAYGGGEWNFHRNAGVERAAARAGLEWRDAPRDDGFDARPFAAVDARVTTLTDRFAVSATAGMALFVEGVTLRLEARGHTGPSPMGQFRDRDEEALGVGLRVEI